MDDLGRMFDPSPPPCPNAYVFTFLQPTKSLKITYREQQELLRIALEEEDKFSDGFILDTIEKGVHHPVVHVRRLQTEAPTLLSRTFLSIRNDHVVGITRDAARDAADADRIQDEKLNSSVALMKEGDLGPDVCVQQGVFKELKRIEPDYSFSKRDRLEHRAFLLVGMRNIEPRVTSVLENWWRDWTGARSIYLKLRHEHDLGRVEHINAYISLYRDLDVTPTSTSGKSLVRDDVTSAEESEKRIIKKSRGFQANLEWRRDLEVDFKGQEPSR